jgi:hypothetical protein
LKTRLLFIVSAVLEVGIGLALLVSPALVVPILIGAPFETPADLVIGRVAGAALLALAVACWLARNDERTPTASGLIVSMLIYNVAAALLLAYAGMGLRLFGIGLWPAAALHVVMAVWCLVNTTTSLETRRPGGREVA